jgi:hypothetical protein
MKNILFFTLFFTTFTSFSQEKTMNSLGKAKIGMSIIDFNTTFRTSINNTKYSIKVLASHLKITDNIVIKNVTYGFQKRKLTFIKCDYDKFLFDGLNQIYGLKNIRKTKSNETFFEFETRSPKITSVGLLNKELIVFDNAIRKNKNLREYANASMKEVDSHRTYKDL